MRGGGFRCDAPLAAWYLRSKLMVFWVWVDAESWVESSSDETDLSLLLVGTVLPRGVGPWLVA